MPGTFIRDRNAEPPGGYFFFEHDGEAIEPTRSIEIAERRVAALLARHGVRDVFPFVALSEYMCPRVATGYCTTPSSIRRITVREVKGLAETYFRLRAEPFGVISERLGVCADCPKNNRRVVCIPCTGFAQWIIAGFGGRRGRLPADAFAGVCECAHTFASVAATVAYGNDAPEWPEPPPENCWRLKEK